jgi:membrane fusion protein, multidrug efflux system
MRTVFKKRGAFVVASAVFATVGAAMAITLHAGKPPAPNSPVASAPIAVSVAAVVQRQLTAWDEFSGRLEAIDHVDLRARVSGAVQSVHYREGALVKAGDLMVSIDPAPYAAEVERAQAQVAAADARVLHLRNEQQRAERLWQEQAIAQRELDERTDAVREAEANLRAAHAVLTSARLNLGYTQVRAPISGRAGKVDVTIGNLVAAGPGAAVLTTLVSVTPIYASFDVDEQVVLQALKDVPGAQGDRSHIGRIPVRMGTGADAGTPHEGQLHWVDNKVDPRSGTVRVRASFDNPDGALFPGQFARLRLGRAKTRDAVLISERAVGTDQNRQFVLVVGGDQKAAYREVKLGPSVDGLRIVNEGLSPGERVVVSGLQRVKPGAVVAPQPIEMAAQPADGTSDGRRS